MARKVDTQEFIKMAKLKHGNKYDYSKSIYTMAKNSITITCPTHGDFVQRASTHLSGSGCPLCFQEKNRNKGLICGVGKNDVGQSDMKLFSCWRGMIYRCYGKKPNGYNKSYNDCTVIEAWHTLSVFSEWFYKNYVDGWQLDKDILSNGDKVYSPQTCCFVPREINMVLAKKDAKGISFVKQAWKVSYAGIYLGRYKTQHEARSVYNKAKANHIRELSEIFKSRLRDDVYMRLNNYALRLVGLNELANNLKIE